VFSNPVTLLSGLGTIIVTFGVLCYTIAKQKDGARLALKLAQEQEVSVHKLWERDCDIIIEFKNLSGNFPISGMNSYWICDNYDS